MPGLDGSMARLIAPVPSFTYRIFFQVLPPSVVLNTPRCGLEAKRWPSAATYTTSGLGRLNQIPVIVVGFSKPEDFPPLAAVGDFVHPVPVKHRVARRRTARAAIDDLRARGRNGNGAEVAVLEIFVGDILQLWP